MNDKQKSIVRKLQWIFYPIAGLMLLQFLGKFITAFSGDSSSNSTSIDAFLEWFDKALLWVVLGVTVIALVAILQQFFVGGSTAKRLVSDPAPKANIIWQKEAQKMPLLGLLLFLVAVGFAVLFTLLVFFPQMILNERVLQDVSSQEKLVVGLFFVLANFLVIVFGKRLFSRQPPIFVATAEGFCYEPAGISSGWIRWNDIEEVRETNVLAGSRLRNGPSTIPALGIRLKNPEAYNLAAFTPLMRKLVSLSQDLRNYETDGVGDLLLDPVDFGNDYDHVKSIIKKYARG